MAEGELHEISAAIGALQNEARRAHEHRTLVYKKLEEISNQLAVVPAVIKDVEEMKPVVDRLERDRQRRLAWIAGLGTGAAFSGAWIYDMIQRFFTK